LASRRSEIQEDLTFRALRLIGENPTTTQRDLANRAGISVGAAHYCLSALAEKGLIKLGNFQASKNKRCYAYILTPKGIAAKAQLAVSFLKRKLAEYDALKDEIDDLKRELGGAVDEETSHK
jgi:EPS-associated MarR family transcriptional regulator